MDIIILAVIITAIALMIFLFRHIFGTDKLNIKYVETKTVKATVISKRINHPSHIESTDPYWMLNVQNESDILKITVYDPIQYQVEVEYDYIGFKTFTGYINNKELYDTISIGDTIDVDLTIKYKSKDKNNDWVSYQFAKENNSTEKKTGN